MVCCDTKSSRSATKNPSLSSVKLTYLGAQKDLTEQQNIWIIVNSSFTRLRYIVESSEQSLMPFMSYYLFIYKKIVDVILDRLRPLTVQPQRASSAASKD